MTWKEGTEGRGDKTSNLQKEKRTTKRKSEKMCVCVGGGGGDKMELNENRETG